MGWRGEPSVPLDSDNPTLPVWRPDNSGNKVKEKNKRGKGGPLEGASCLHGIPNASLGQIQYFKVALMQNHLIILPTTAFCLPTEGETLGFHYPRSKKIPHKKA